MWPLWYGQPVGYREFRRRPFRLFVCSVIGSGDTGSLWKKFCSRFIEFVIIEKKLNWKWPIFICNIDCRSQSNSGWDQPVQKEGAAVAWWGYSVKSWEKQLERLESSGGHGRPCKFSREADPASHFFVAWLVGMCLANLCLCYFKCTFSLNRITTRKCEWILWLFSRSPPLTDCVLNQ